jgi:TonB family protein
MLARALLFSSDEQTTRLLTEILAEAQFETEHSSEILVAVEQLTKGAFQVVLTDWDQPFEASFLLKTARELKTTESILAIAIVRPDDANNALRAGANAVLTKPCSAEQVRNSLLALRDLLSDEPIVPEQPPVLETVPIAETAPIALPRKFLPAELQTDPVPLRSEPERAPVVVNPPIFASLFPEEEVDEGTISPKRGLKNGLVAAVFVAIVVLFLGAWRLGYLSSQSITYEILAAQAPVVGDTSFRPEQWLWEDSHAAAPTHVNVFPVPPGAGTITTKAESPFAPLPMPLPPSPAEPIEPSGLPLIRPLFPVNSAHPQVPPSLSAPFPVMPAVSHPRMDSLNTKWTAEPPLLPEEVTRALVLREVTPSYPEQALNSGLQGTVVLQVWIAKDGTVRDAKLVRGQLAFGKAAFDAVRQWRYKPYLVNGEPVEVQTLITLNFKQS